MAIGTQHPSAEIGQLAGSTLYRLVLCDELDVLWSRRFSANHGWEFLPIYLGPMLVFIFGWPVLSKFNAVVKTHRIGSLADFMSARYGRSQPLAF